MRNIKSSKIEALVFRSRGITGFVIVSAAACGVSLGWIGGTETLVPFQQASLCNGHHVRQGICDGNRHVTLWSGNRRQ
jgi:hypothetical protein